MKIFKLYILISLTLYSCNSKNEENKKDLQTIVGDYSKINESKHQFDYYVKGDSISTKPITDHPQLSYKFNIDSTGKILKSIFVYLNLIKVQEIIADKDIERNEFRLIDWNFDGYKDISVLYNCGSVGCSYWIWNYSPKSNKYYFNKDLSEVIGLDINIAEKSILFHNRIGYSEENWDTLKYINNKLTFVKGLHQERWNDELGNSWIKHTYSKIRNNKRIIKVDSSIIK